MSTMTLVVGVALVAALANAVRQFITVVQKRRAEGYLKEQLAQDERFRSLTADYMESIDRHGSVSDEELREIVERIERELDERAPLGRRSVQEALRQVSRPARARYVEMLVTESAERAERTERVSKVG